MSEIDYTRNNTLNNSTSKQQFSFSKVDRFKQKLKTEGADIYYKVPDTREKKCYSFGKTGRYDMFDIECRIKNLSPPPGFYELQTDIDKLLKKRQGVKILYGRQCKSGNIFNKSDIPGPGAYNPNPQCTQPKMTRSITMSKMPLSKRLIKQQPLPGPGSYKLNSLLINENKILSKYKKKAIGKCIFPEQISKRVKTQIVPQLRLPQVNVRGEHSIRPDKGFSLSKSQRFKLETLEEIPGPGSYNKFSEFIENIKRR